MGTTSSFFGGGGGGGDPQAVFEAASSISANDLVTLKSNGTIEVVVSNPTALSLGAEDYTRPTFPLLPEFTNNKETKVFYYPTQDKYLILTRNNSDSTIYILTASLSGNTLTVQANNGGSTETLTSCRGFDAAWDENTETVVVSMVQTNDYAGLYNIVYSTFDNRFERSDTANNMGGATYTGDFSLVSTNNDGTGVAMYLSGNDTKAYIFTLPGTGARPTIRGGPTNVLGGNTVVANTNSYNFLFNVDNKKYGVFFMIGSLTSQFGSITDNGTTISSTVETNSFTTNTALGKGKFAYDPVNKIGIVGSSENGSFRTFHMSGVTPSASATLAGFPVGTAYNAVTYMSNIGKFVSLAVNTGVNGEFNLSVFGVDKSTSACTEVITETFSSFAGTNTGTNILLEFPSIFAPDPDSDKVVIVANNNLENKEIQIVGNPKYLDTNMDSYFGEAKEDISSGSTGSVAILKREATIPGGSFDKGQKLYSNSSGAVPSTSGTNVVGYATGTNTILVTGDQA